MIHITVNAKDLDIKVTGHAGSGEVGHDIVCASVSILIYTLAQCLNDKKVFLKKLPRATLKDGYSHIRCFPQDEFADCITTLYWMTVNGLRLIEERYPEFVKIHMV
jgi:uncharacterized protein